MTNEEKEEKEEEDWKLMHVLMMPEADKTGFCKTKCTDIVCDHGCLRQNAKVFRPSIMHGIKIAREQGSNKYPLYVTVASDYNHHCPGGELGTIGSNQMICRDPVCQVSGCLNKPAFHFRRLIKLAMEEELIEALKK